MPLINLIESQKLAARMRDQQLRTSKIVFVASIAIAALGYSTVLLQSGDISSELQQIDKKIKAVAPLVKQIDDLKKEENDLSPRLKILQDAQLLTGRWGRIMNHLAVNTPPNTWLTNLRSASSDPEKPIVVSVVGVAKSQTDVSEFVLRWQNAKDVESANLHYSQEKLLEKSQAVEFEVGGEIVGTAEKKKAAEVKPS